MTDHAVRTAAMNMARLNINFPTMCQPPGCFNSSTIWANHWAIKDVAISALSCRQHAPGDIFSMSPKKYTSPENSQMNSKAHEVGVNLLWSFIYCNRCAFAWQSN